MKAIIFNILTCTFIACTLITTAFAVNLITANAKSDENELLCNAEMIDTFPKEDLVNIQRVM